MFRAYVSVADKYDLVDIKATNCIVVAHLTKVAISIFSWLHVDREQFDLPPTFLLAKFQRKFHNCAIFRPIFMIFALKG